MSYSYELGNYTPYIENNAVIFQSVKYPISKINEHIINNKKITKIECSEVSFTFLNGVAHNELDNPSVFWADGSLIWFHMGKIHRENALPAIIWNFEDNKSFEYWINNKKISEEEAIKMKLNNSINKF